MTILQSLNICEIINESYRFYISIYLTIYQFAVSILVMMTFGWFINRNIERTHAVAEHQADRHLVEMTIILVFLIIFCTSTLYLPIMLKKAWSACKSSLFCLVFTVLFYIY